MKKARTNEEICVACGVEAQKINNPIDLFSKIPQNTLTNKKNIGITVAWDKDTQKGSWDELSKETKWMRRRKKVKRKQNRVNKEQQNRQIDPSAIIPFSFVDCLQTQVKSE